MLCFTYEWTRFFLKKGCNSTKRPIVHRKKPLFCMSEKMNWSFGRDEYKKEWPPSLNHQATVTSLPCLVQGSNRSITNFWVSRRFQKQKVRRPNRTAMQSRHRGTDKIDPADYNSFRKKIDSDNFVALDLVWRSRARSAHFLSIPSSTYSRFQKIQIYQHQRNLNREKGAKNTGDRRYQVKSSGVLGIWSSRRAFVLFL